MFEYTETKKRPASSRYIETRSKSYSDLSKNPPRPTDTAPLGYLSAIGRNRHSELPAVNTPNVLSVACGEKHTVYLNSKYEVFVVGDNQSGQLGIQLPYTPTPVQVMKDKVVSNVYAGPYCTFMVTCRGELFATGKNNKGQLGLGSLVDQTVPVMVEQLSQRRNTRGRMKTIVASSSTVLTQRQTFDNILKDQTPEKKKFFEASSNESNCCLLEDNEQIKQIVCGPLHSLVFTTNGRLFTSGVLLHNLANSDECSTEFVELKYGRLGRIDQISAGLTLNAVLTSEGRVYLWGVLNEKYIFEPTLVDIKNMVEVALGGSNFNFVVNSKGEVYEILDFEQGKYFRTRKVEGLPCVKAMSCGVEHAVALTEGKMIYGWGSNKYGQIGDSQMAQSGYTQPPTLIQQLTSINRVACGSYHTTVLTSSPTPRDSKSICSSECPASESNNYPLVKKETRAVKTQTLTEATSSKFQIPTNVNPRTFTASLEIPFDQLILEKQISEGGYGIIYKGKWRETTVAVKLFKIDGSENGVKDFLSECHAMEVMRHPNIVMFLGACTKPPHYAIVLQYCSKGTLWSILHSSMELGWEDRRRFALDTAKGMHYLHSSEVPILHRDLKSLNLLIDQSYRIKLADFGWTKGLENYMTGKIGTYQWMAPEVISGQKYTEKADVFSFGIILWEIASREPPYRNVSGHQVSIEVVNSELRPPVPKKCPQPFGRLMKRCWDRRAQTRPSFKEIIRELQSMKLTQ